MDSTVMERGSGNGKENGNDHNGLYIGITEKKMETTIMGCI